MSGRPGGGGGEVMLLVVSWILTTGLTFLVVIVDERRMSEDKLERAWPPSSRDAAIVIGGPLALLIHFARTRGHFQSFRGVFGILLGFLMGVVAAAIVLVIASVALEGVAWAFDLPTD